jgi:Fe-S cluster assembly ATP-binding protein
MRTGCSVGLLMLEIKNLCVSIDQKPILKSVSLTIKPGEIHALMGSNGSGKSTFAYTLMGHPAYLISGGSMQLDDQDIIPLSIDKRAQAGIFLAFQNPLEIPGVTVFTFLKEAYAAISKKVISAKEFQQLLFEQMDIAQIDHAFAYRNLNAGFSGGEKKRLELLQLLVLKPKVAILDEIDSGLDVDAIKIVAQSLQAARKAHSAMSIIIITHYPQLLTHIQPDMVHVMSNGSIIACGSAHYAQIIQQRGFDAFQSS